MPFGAKRATFSYAMIRPLTLDDVPALEVLEQALFENSMTTPQLCRELVAGGGYALGDPIEAYALLRFDRGLADLTRLGVAPEHRHQGKGRALLQHLLQAHPHMMLTVKKDNAPALALYRAHRFEVFGHFNAESAWVLLHRPA